MATIGEPMMRRMMRETMRNAGWTLNGTMRF